MPGQLHITDSHLRARGVAVLADYRQPPARPAWLRVGSKVVFLNGRTECEGVVEFLFAARGKASVRISAPAFLRGTASVQRFADLIDADCPPAEDEDADSEGGAA